VTGCDAGRTESDELQNERNELLEKVAGDNWKLNRTKERIFNQANGKQYVNNADQLRKLEIL
jgi:hypothetical protein